MIKLSSDELLLSATANLKKGIEYAIHQIRSKRVDPNIKLRWMRSLTRQVEALVKIAEALNNVESKSTDDLDLSTYLSSLETRIPTKTRSTAMRRARTDFRDVVFRARGMQSTSHYDY